MLSEGQLKVTAKEKDGAYVDMIRTVSALCLFDNKWILDDQPFALGLQHAFEENLPLAEIDDFDKRYCETFGSCRDPLAIAIYTAKIAPFAGGPLARYITAVLQGEFQDTRYQLNDNLHLQTIETTCPGTIDKWKSSLSPVDLENLNPTTDSLEANKLKEWLHAALHAGHLGDQQQFSYLSRFLDIDSQDKVSQAALIKECLLESKTAKIKSAKALSAMRKQENLSKEPPIEQQISNNLILQDRCMKLIYEEKLDKKKSHLTAIENLLKENTQYQDIEFLNDIQALTLQLPKMDKLILLDTDDPYELLLCGTDVNSCQKIDGDPSKNIGLLGYLMDGKIRLLQIKDENGKLIGRCIIKLLWDSKNKIPVLYKEPSYYVNADALFNPKYGNALNELARAKARTLGIPVVTNDSNIGNRSYGNALDALGGPAPEYCDGTHGIANGKYRIAGGILLE